MEERGLIVSYSGTNTDLKEFIKFLNRVYPPDTRAVNIFRVEEKTDK